MAEEECRNCRSWEEEMYWNHFQSHQFSQILHTGFDRRLAIPEQFTKNLKEKLPKLISLKGPSGGVWQADLTTIDGTMFISNGWDEFVNDNLLQENDLLIFKYNGASCFDVLIFDGQSLCEKAASYFVRKCGHKDQYNGSLLKRKTREDSADATIPSHGNFNRGPTPEKSANNDIDTTPLTKPTSSRATTKKIRRRIEEIRPAPVHEDLRGPVHEDIPLPVHEDFKRKARENSADTTIPSHGNFNGGPTPEKSANNDIETTPLAKPTSSRATTQKIWRRIEEIRPAPVHEDFPLPVHEDFSASAEEIETKPDIEHISPSIVHDVPYISSRRYVTEEEKRYALQLAQEALTNNGFLSVMKPTHVSRRFYMSIPSSWMTKHANSLEKQDVILCVGDEMWHTKYYYQKSKNSGGLSSGWKNFAIAHNLQEYDVCVFEPGSKINNALVLNVYIFRVHQEGP